MVWLRVLHVFLAGLFTLWFLRTLRLGSLAALGGALVFAFGSFLTAQMHHENVVRSAVWLPLCWPASNWPSDPKRCAAAPPGSPLGALAFAQSALGLHVQPVLMSALAIAAYAVFRALAGPRPPATPRWSAAPDRCAVAGAFGLAIATVQLLPLAEWALVSSRRNGVDYTFAAPSVSPPRTCPRPVSVFFRLPDGTTWWTLWQQWETEVYVGIPTLALIVVGIVLARRIEVVFFAILGVVSLLIGMAGYAPLVNLHLLLWSVPGFSFLRAPGRFSYLLVFACACLAAFGLQVLLARRARIVVALFGAVPMVGLLAGVLALFPPWRSWLAADPLRAREYVQSTYLSARAQLPIDPGLIVQGMLASLDLTNPKTLWTLILLVLSAVAFIVWLELARAAPHSVNLCSSA